MNKGGPNLIRLKKKQNVFEGINKGEPHVNLDTDQAHLVWVFT